MTLHDLPALNAFLNGTAAVLLVTAFILIKQGRRDAHKKVMLAAFTVSTLFLISYLTYHFQVGVTRYPHTGAIRTVYYTILFTHTVLAARGTDACDHHAASGVEGRVRAAQENRPLDAADLAVRERHGRGRLFDAVSVLKICGSMVSGPLIDIRGSEKHWVTFALRRNTLFV